MSVYGDLSPIDIPAPPEITTGIAANPSGQIANEFHKPKSRLTIWLARRILTPQIAWILARDRFRASSQDHYSTCSASFPFAVAASNQTT